MRSQVMGGIQDRADAFVRKCVESGKSGIDAYVSLYCLCSWITLTFEGVPTLLRIRLCFSPPLWSIWYPFDREERGLGNDGGTVIP